MTALPPPLSSTNSTSSTPWKFLGSVSSVSPASPFEGDSLGTTMTTSKTKGALNDTGFYIDDDGESVLSDLKTVIIACVATLVPLIITLATIFGMRILWIQYKTRKKAVMAFDGAHARENTSGSTSKPLHTHLLNDKASIDTHMDITYEAVEICDEVSPASDNRSSNVNGSIITMTLTNSHLIVETEERNDIDEDSRETTMRYSPGARGVFVVEVQQGLRRSPGAGGPASIAEPERSISLSDQCALVHSPPEKFSNEETKEECDKRECYVDATATLTEEQIQKMTSKTGLATSTTSLSSQRQSYRYATQLGYDRSYGYEHYLGYDEGCPGGRTMAAAEDTRPKIMSALYKTNTKSISFDVGMDRAKGAPASGHNNNRSLDDVLESSGFEGFPANLYESKLPRRRDDEPAGDEPELSENNGDLGDKKLN